MIRVVGYCPLDPAGANTNAVKSWAFAVHLRRFRLDSDAPMLRAPAPRGGPDHQVNSMTAPLPVMKAHLTMAPGCRRETAR